MKCPRCGINNPEIARFCYDCGNPIPKYAQVPPFTWRDKTQQCRTPEELVPIAERCWAEAVSYLHGGNWERWFRDDLKRNDLVAQIATVKAAHASQDAALDAFLRFLDPSFPQPVLRLAASALDFGVVPWQAQRSLDLDVINGGSGCLSGRLSGLPAWLQASPLEFANHARQMLKLTVKTDGLTPSRQPYAAQFIIDAGMGGRALVAVSLTVPEPQLALDMTVVDLGSAYQGEALSGSLMIHNHGGSAFEAGVTKDASWVNVSPSKLWIEAGKSKEVQVTAGTAQMKLGRHSAKLTVEAKGGGWSQVGEAQIIANLPWFKTFWQRWAVTLDWAAVGMLLALVWFGITRPELLGENSFSGKFRPVYFVGELPALLAIASGWLGILLFRVGRPEYKLEGCWVRLLALVLPWLFNPLSALAGTAIAASGVVLALRADVWPGLLVSLVLCGVVGAVAAGLLHRPAKTQRRSWSGLFGAVFSIVVVVGIMYLGMQPRFWWRLAGTVVMPASGSNVTQWAFVPGGATLASGSSGSTTWLWRVSDGVFLPALTDHGSRVRSAAFTPAGTMLATGSDDYAVRLWRVSDGRLLRTLECAGSVDSIAFSPDGTILASGCSDRTVRLWRVSDGALLRTLQGYEQAVVSMAFAPDGTMLASTSSATVWLWQVSDGELLHKLDAHGAISSVAFAPDGGTLATGSHQGDVELWRASDGALLQTLKGNTYRDAQAVAFAPDGATLAASSSDGMVRLWQLSDGRLLRTLVGHTDSVDSMVFAPDGGTLASVSSDGTVKLWRVGDKNRPEE